MQWNFRIIILFLNPIEAKKFNNTVSTFHYDYYISETGYISENFTFLFILLHYSLTSSPVKKVGNEVLHQHLDTREVSKTSRQDEMISKVAWLSN